MALENIDLDVEARRVSEAEAKAKAAKTQQLLDEQEAKIRALMAQQDLENSEPDLEEFGLRYLKPGFKKAGKFIKGMEYDKGKKPEDYEIDITQKSKEEIESPIPVKFPYANINEQMKAEKENAEKQGTPYPYHGGKTYQQWHEPDGTPYPYHGGKTYQQWHEPDEYEEAQAAYKKMGIDWAGPNREGFNRNMRSYTAMPPKEEVPADKTAVEVPKTEAENWWLNQLTPQVNNALAAIADKDPSLLQLPEVKELLKRSSDGYDRQMKAYDNFKGVAAMAPWTTEPEQTYNLANQFREQGNTFRVQGDKNLMDAADNLEKIRSRQLEATKAVADDLTRQKGVLQGLGSSVLGLQGNGLMALPSVYESAINANLEGNKVHEVGDARLKAAQASVRTFVDSSIDAMIKPDDKKAKAAGTAILNDLRKQINNGEISESSWYDTIEDGKVKPGIITKLSALKGYLNEPSQKDLQARIDAMNNDLATYKAAMASERQYKDQSNVAMNKGDQMFNTIAGVGESFKMPLMSLNAGGANIQSTPREIIQTPVGELEEAYGKVKPKKDEPSIVSESREQAKPNDSNTGGKPKQDEPKVSDNSDGSLRMYNKIKSTLDKYMAANLNANNLATALNEGNSTPAAATRANALRDAARLAVQKDLGELLKEYSQKKTQKSIKVFYDLMTDPNYSRIIKEFNFNPNANTLYNDYNAIPEANRNLSFNGNKAIQDQNNTIQNLMIELGMA